MTGRIEAKPRRAFVTSALALAAVLALLGAVGACTSRSVPQADQGSNGKTVLIPVEGMSCAACAARVRKALASVSGVSDVEVSLVGRRAQVRFDPGRVTSEQLVAAINDLGYRAGTPAEAP